MIHRTNRDVIEFLEEEIDRGEYSTGTHVDVVGRLKNYYPRLADEFNVAYTEYCNDDAMVSDDLIARVVHALKKIPEPEPPKQLLL